MYTRKIIFIFNRDFKKNVYDILNYIKLKLFRTVLVGNNYLLIIAVYSSMWCVY